MKKKRKIVLAYSGGLDTSIILKWLQKNYNADVITYTADIGQKINKSKIINSAKKLGVKKIIIENLKNTFEGSDEKDANIKLANEINELKKLHFKGILTNEGFKKAKEKILK